MPTQAEDCRVFLSYNRADVAVARSVGAHLALAGVKVWFDEWNIKAGDSIPGRLNEGLQGFDAFVILWSERASRSAWVRQETEHCDHPSAGRHDESDPESFRADWTRLRFRR